MISEAEATDLIRDGRYYLRDVEEFIDRGEWSDSFQGLIDSTVESFTGPLFVLDSNYTFNTEVAYRGAPHVLVHVCTGREQYLDRMVRDYCRCVKAAADDFMLDEGGADIESATRVMSHWGLTTDLRVNRAVKDYVRAYYVRYGSGGVVGHFGRKDINDMGKKVAGALEMLKFLM